MSELETMGLYDYLHRQHELELASIDIETLRKCSGCGEYCAESDMVKVGLTYICKECDEYNRENEVVTKTTK